MYEYIHILHKIYLNCIYKSIYKNLIKGEVNHTAE